MPEHFLLVLSLNPDQVVRTYLEICIMCDRLNGTTKHHEMFLSSFNSACLTCLQFLSDDISCVLLVTSQLSPPMYRGDNS